MLVAFTFYAVTQFGLGVAFTALVRPEVEYSAGTLRGKRHSRGLICHPRTVLFSGLKGWNYRLAYASASLGFGKDMLRELVGRFKTVLPQTSYHS